MLPAVTPSRAAEPALAIPGGSLRVVQRGAATVVAVTQHARTRATVLLMDDGIYAGSLGATRIVGAAPGRFVVLLSEYASRPNGGSHQCGAGTEAVLRVISLRPAPQQTLHVRTGSCWQDIEEGGISWDGKANRLTVERTIFNEGGASRLRVAYRITPEGRVAEVRTDHLT